MNREKRKYAITLKQTARFSVFSLSEDDLLSSASASPSSSASASSPPLKPDHKRARITSSPNTTLTTATATAPTAPTATSPTATRNGNTNGDGNGIVDQSSANLIRLKESKWLSDQLLAVSLGVQNIQLSSPDVLQVLEPHLQKARLLRSQQLLHAQQYRGHATVQEITTKLGKLAQEEVLSYNTAVFDMKRAFCEALGLGLELGIKTSSDSSANSSSSSGCANFNLEKLHELGGAHANADLGHRKERHHKRELLAPLLHAQKREIFQTVYEKLILEYILPHVQATLPLSSRTNEMYFQAFPCVRLVRPGEFSIGIHADCSYGFQAGNINFYLPLTRISGTNSLILESSPGQEDWHFLDLDYGQIQRFHGAVCAHFTPENTSIYTRVSFDFRVICGIVYQENQNSIATIGTGTGQDKEGDRFSATPGYYVKAIYVDDSQNGEREQGQGQEAVPAGRWMRNDPTAPLPIPDYRTGFPFTNK